MKNMWIISTVLVSSLGAVSAQAGHDDDDDRAYRSSSDAYYDRAKVTRVQPIVDVVRVPTEHRECWTEEVEHSARRSDPNAGMLIGGIIGGVVGHQMGHGRGNKAATAAGAVIGAAVGRRAARDDYEPGYSTDERRCRVDHGYEEHERVSGYRVTYRYQGRLYTTRMNDEPGKFIRVRVAVNPETD